MKRRAPDERVETFRHRFHPAEAKPIKEALVEWCEEHAPKIMGAEPKMPAGIQDRAADCWEPLLAVADVAGDDWPKRGREAATYLNGRSADETLTSGVELLQQIEDAFGADDKLWTETLLERLCSRDELPWKDIYGKPLNDRGLAKRLKAYGVKSKDVWLTDKTKKGYSAADFHDVWKRYRPSCPLRAMRARKLITITKTSRTSRTSRLLGEKGPTALPATVTPSSASKTHPWKLSDKLWDDLEIPHGLKEDRHMSNRWPQNFVVRGYVINNLRHGPVACSVLFDYGRSQFGFTIEDAGRHLGVLSEELNDETYWMRPANLFAIWWGNRPAHHHERQKRSEGAA